MAVLASGTAAPRISRVRSEASTVLGVLPVRDREGKVSCQQPPAASSGDRNMVRFGIEPALGACNHGLYDQPVAAS